MPLAARSVLTKDVSLEFDISIFKNIGFISFFSVWLGRFHSLGSRTLIRLGELHIYNETDCTVTQTQKLCAPPVEEYGIDEVIAHPNYSKPTRYLNDIALIRLNKTITEFKCKYQLLLTNFSWAVISLWGVGFSTSCVLPLATSVEVGTGHGTHVNARLRSQRDF